MMKAFAWVAVVAALSGCDSDKALFRDLDAGLVDAAVFDASKDSGLAADANPVAVDAEMDARPSQTDFAADAATTSVGAAIPERCAFIFCNFPGVHLLGQTQPVAGVTCN